jgi:hypothetical protein
LPSRNGWIVSNWACATSDPYEDGEVTRSVKEPLEIPERFGNDVMGRRHERRVGEGAARGSDPVLAAA